MITPAMSVNDDARRATPRQGTRSLLFRASPNARVCVQAGAVLVGVVAAARFRAVAVDIDAGPVAMSPRPIAVAIVGGMAVRVGPGATVSAAVTAREAGTSAPSAGRSRKAGGPGTRRSAGTSETSGPADAGRSRKACARRTAAGTTKTAAGHTGRRTANGARRRSPSGRGSAGRRARHWLGQRDIRCGDRRAEHRARGQDQ